MKIKFRLTIGFMALLGFFADAQEELSLNKAISHALENKAEAVKAKLDYENSQYQVEQVRANALPQVNFSAGLSYSPLLQEVNIMNQVIKMGQKWNTNAGISLSQQLFNQSVFIGLKAAKTTREFYAINQQLTNEQLIEKVATTYYQVYQTKQQLKTIETNLNSTTKTRDVIQGLHKSGLAKKIDLDRTNVAVNNLQSSKQQILNALQLQEHSLKFMIGMDINQPITMPEDTFEANPLLLSEEANVENRTEIKLINKQLELLELDKKAAKAEYYPTLMLTGSFSYNGMGDKFPWFSKEASYYPYSVIGLSLNVPIFNGFSTRSKVRQKEISIKKAEIDKRETELALNLDIQNAKTQINNSLITIETQKGNVDLAKSVLENTQNNYRYGLATLTDLLEAENAYADAQNNHTNALLEYKLAEIKLIKAKGELNNLAQQ